MLWGLVALIIVGLWGLLYSNLIPYYVGFYKTVLPIFTVLLVLFAIPVLFMKIFSKDFDAYYNSLSEVEKQQFERELANVKSSQKIIMTSKAVVHIDFIVIKAIPYENIRSFEKSGRAVMLKGEQGCIAVLKASTHYSTDAIIKELQSYREQSVS